MSDLFNNLQKHTQAFEVYSRVVEVKSNNISHLHDEHYAKQTAHVSSGGNYVAKGGFRSHGVILSDVESTRSEVLDENIVKTITARGSLDAQRDFADLLQNHFSIDLNGLSESSETAATGGMADSISQFFNAWERLAANPSDSTAKANVYSMGENLADRFQNIDSQIKTLQTDIDSKLSKDADQVANVLNKIIDSNDRIARLEINTTQKALEERDNRQKHLEELAQYVNFEVREKTTVPGGMEIVMKDTSNADVFLVDHNRIVNTLAYDGTNITTAGASPVTLSVTGGRLHGYMDFKANTLANTLTDIDNLARQLTTSVNLAYNPTFVTGDFFHPAGSTAANFALHPTLLVSNIKSTDSTQPGANELSLGVANLSKKQFSTGSGDFIDGNFTEYYSNSVTSLGQAVNTIEQKHGIEVATEKRLVSDRSSRSGVSVDEEVAELMVLQKTINANMKLIKVNADLLDALVNIIN